MTSPPAEAFDRDAVADRALEAVRIKLAALDHEHAMRPERAVESTSMAANVVALLEATRLNPGGAPEQGGPGAFPSEVPRAKSGQYKFAKAKNYQTKLADGTIIPGIHGISLCAGPMSSHAGPKCAVCCKIHDLRKCSRCKRVYYCDVHCQKFDWPRHKAECSRVDASPKSEEGQKPVRTGPAPA